MFRNIFELFQGDSVARKPQISLELAAAALLVEVMASDDEWQDVEERRIRELLATTLNIDPGQALELFDSAKKHHKTAHDLYEVIKLINDNYTPDQKYQLVVNLWKVAYADGNLDRYEDYTIRKIAELLYVPHVQFIQAKLSVKPD